MANDTNVTWHEHSVSRDEREQLNGHKGCVIWFTGAFPAAALETAVITRRVTSISTSAATAATTNRWQRPSQRGH
jgi:adenylylsulfate kinase-like enzyme